MPPTNDWSLDDLDVAYSDGLKAGIAGQPFSPPSDEILAASWEAGWIDACEQLRRRQVLPDIPFVWDHFPPLLSVRIQNRSARPPLGLPDFGLRMQTLVPSNAPAPCVRRGSNALELRIRISNSSSRPPLSTPDFGLRMQRLTTLAPPS
ncbi:hypothetical protein FEA48_10660 [Pseudomonas nitroreducens]|uniref:Uncharacterized protein n=1 Tax=Pseudomonas nitroreducens TaxID=46680 RepID=A0A5R9A7J6_PSENT|nr:hypothetical protein [Pseudomonas nitroreducens]TLP74671.1 hypothetical protein FEA48_10660 [Pseudomonas nitroreducens]